MTKPRQTAVPERLTLVVHFDALKDPRRHQHKVIYPLPYLLLVAFSAALCGLNDWDAAADFAEEKKDWLRELWPIDVDETPSADTLERVFSRLDPKVFRECLVRWMQEIAHRRGTDSEKVRQLALDGKSIQGARDPAAPTVPLHLVHAYLVEHQLLLGMEPVVGAPGEARGAGAILDVVELRGVVVTGDANLLTRDLADKIVEQGGDYLLALKGNRGPAHAAVEKKLCQPDRTLDEQTTSALATSTHDGGEESGHGRIERRRAWALAADHFPEVKKYLPHAASVLAVVRERRSSPGATGVKPSTEVGFYVSSRAPEAEALAGWVRGHWGIENVLHRSLDVVCHEDASNVAKGPGAENLATIRRVALARLRGDTSIKGSAPKKMRRATLNDAYRARLLTQAFS